MFDSPPSKEAAPGLTAPQQEKRRKKASVLQHSRSSRRFSGSMEDSFELRMKEVLPKVLDATAPKAVEEIPDDELFEKDYIENVLSQPYRSAAVRWMFDGGGIGAIMLLAFGPFGFAIGIFVGAILGLCYGLLSDLIRLKHKQSQIARQRARVKHLIRWADYHFASSDDKFQLLYKVILEYQALTRLGGVSSTARRSLRPLYSFLKRPDVQHVIEMYLELFFANWRKMSFDEITLCRTIFDVCINCCAHVAPHRPPPAIVALMQQFLKENPSVALLFGRVAELASAREDAEEQQRLSLKKAGDWVAYADAGALTAPEVFREDLKTAGPQIFFGTAGGTLHMHSALARFRVPGTRAAGDGGSSGIAGAGGTIPGGAGGGAGDGGGGGLNGLADARRGIESSSSAAEVSSDEGSAGGSAQQSVAPSSGEEEAPGGRGGRRGIFQRKEGSESGVSSDGSRRSAPAATALEKPRTPTSSLTKADANLVLRGKKRPSTAGTGAAAAVPVALASKAARAGGGGASPSPSVTTALATAHLLHLDSRNIQRFEHTSKNKHRGTAAGSFERQGAPAAAAYNRFTPDIGGGAVNEAAGKEAYGAAAGPGRPGGGSPTFSFEGTGVALFSMPDPKQRRTVSSLLSSTSSASRRYHHSGGGIIELHQQQQQPGQHPVEPAPLAQQFTPGPSAPWEDRQEAVLPHHRQRQRSGQRSAQLQRQHSSMQLPLYSGTGVYGTGTQGTPFGSADISLTPGSRGESGLDPYANRRQPVGMSPLSLRPKPDDLHVALSSRQLGSRDMGGDVMLNSAQLEDRAAAKAADSARSKPADTRGSQGAAAGGTTSIGRKSSSPSPAASAVPEKQLFRSLTDLENFEEPLKHQTPIGAYEFKFLLDLEPLSGGSNAGTPVSGGSPGRHWDNPVNKAHIKVFKLKGESPVIMVKAYAELDGLPAEVVTHFIRHIPTRGSWDKTFDDYKLVETDVGGNEIIYCSMKAPWPIANRDFLQWRRTQEEGDGATLILMRSAAHPNFPPRAGVVRAETIISGYIVRRHAPPKPPTGCSLFILAQTDVRGLLPKFAVNQAAQRAPLSWTESLRKACEKYIKKHGSALPPYTSPLPCI